MDNHTTWDNKPLTVTYTMTGPPHYRAGGNTAEANVKRTFEPSGELYSAIFDLDTGILNTETAQAMTLYDKTLWIHLYDCICCRSVSPAEAWDCINAGRVSEHVTTRASNYMHLC